MSTRDDTFKGMRIQSRDRFGGWICQLTDVSVREPPQQSEHEYEMILGCIRRDCLMLVSCGRTSVSGCFATFCRTDPYQTCHRGTNLRVPDSQSLRPARRISGKRLNRTNPFTDSLQTESDIGCIKIPWWRLASAIISTWSTELTPGIPRASYILGYRFVM